MFCCALYFFFIFFFFKQKTAYEMRISDWSSDVCSSDLYPGAHSSLSVRLRRRPGRVWAWGREALLHWQWTIGQDAGPEPKNARAAPRRVGPADRPNRAPPDA